jgi:DNA mismatch repair ATPase MutS
MSQINEDSLKRLEGKWKSFKDTGEEFKEADHNYSNDLDIFGKGSLFQFINTANTYLGREKLSKILTSPNYSAEEIYARQEAVKELSLSLGWRQRFMAEGRIVQVSMKKPEAIIKWGRERSSLFSNTLIIFLSRILPAITITIILVYLIMRSIPYYIPIIAIAVQIIILKLNSKESDRILELIYEYKKDIEIYREILRLIEKKNFSTEYLKNLKISLINKESQTVTKQINNLSSIVSLIEDRKNFFYSLINFITLWEFQCLIRLEAWKKQSGSLIEQWLKVIADLETLVSLAAIKHDYPQWSMPKIESSSLMLKAENISHPLLTKNPVYNNLRMDSSQSILLITGSNMSGKSTLLRTAGINLVLAYTGAPVCAKSFGCSIMDIYTCMRISDNLEENISSFYAEILRIRKLMDSTKEKTQVFFLLDEIFRGTNSKDRHTGARILIEKLSKENSIGMVSTHDLELGDIEQKNTKVKNYHFKEHYENNKIKFDYKLRLGVSNTRNAIYLMRMAGIEIDEE